MPIRRAAPPTTQQSSAPATLQPPKTFQKTATAQAAEAAAKLPLDDVLDFLQSPEGAKHVTALRASLQKNGAELDGEVAHPLLEGMPQDFFEAKVTEFLYGSFLRGKEINAAIPQAVVWAFAHIADDKGFVEREGVDKVFSAASPLFQVIAHKLSAEASTHGLPTTRRKTKYRWLPEAVGLTVARSRADDGIKARMPVLAEVSRLLGGKNKLKGLESIAVQHLFPSTRSLYESLADNGLDRAKTMVIGKPYSTDQDTFRSMRADGWEVSWMSEMSIPGRDGNAFDDQAARLKAMFKDVDPKTTTKRFLLLDEGGKALKALHEHFPEYAHLCVGVEHTDRGIQLLEGIELKCPVINVARSEAKKRYESPMIGESVVAAIDGMLKSINVTIEPREATILGYGAVGQNVAQSLVRRGFKVHVYDTDPTKMAKAKADGMTTGTREEMLAHGHLLVGATGRGCLSPAEYHLLPKTAVMANAASGRHEFGLDDICDVDAQGLSGDPHEKVDDSGLRTNLIRGERVVVGDFAGNDEQFHRPLRDDNDPTVERLALANGFVVNMQEDIPPEFIQLTRALILAGCLQAKDAQGTGGGLVDLDHSTQDFIVGRVKKHLASEGLSLEAPDFRGIMDT